MIIKNERKHYASDLTDSQWAMIAPLFPPAGHKSKWDKRELVDAVLYLVENGCKWRNLPHASEAPPVQICPVPYPSLPAKKQALFCISPKIRLAS